LEAVIDHIHQSAESILKDPFFEDRKWSLQGFGMLRMYLPGDMRLNILDSRYQYKPKPSMIHDHPWDFTSWVVCGELYNHRYAVGPAYTEKLWNYYQRTVRPGVDPQHLGQDKIVSLCSSGSEIVRAGNSYFQEFDEVHETEFKDGTITVNSRQRGNRPDTARVFYRVGEEWISAEPRSATQEEVKDICDNALKLWF
jgi:hypothetical protein